MKKTMKSIITAILATALIAGVQLTAFAAVSASEPDDANEIVVGQESDDDVQDDTADSTSNAINQSPNTGVAAAPFAAALLAAASVPVMLIAGKKK